MKGSPLLVKHGSSTPSHAHRRASVLSRGPDGSRYVRGAVRGARSGLGGGCWWLMRLCLSSPTNAPLTQIPSSAQHHYPPTTDKMYHGPVAVPAPYFDPAFAHAKPATGAGDIPVAAGAPTAAVTDDDGSHASNGFCIAQGMDALIESFEASAATTLSDPASPNYDATPAARESPTVPSMTALPSLSQHQQQHRWGRLMPSPPTSRKAISSHIAGTGTFMVMYQRGPAGGFDGWSRGPKLVPMCRSPG